MIEVTLISRTVYTFSISGLVSMLTHLTHFISTFLLFPLLHLCYCMYYISGKYIYITEEEMASIVNFLNKRGRVNINEVVAASNSLIDLTGTHQEIVLQDDEEQNTTTT